MRIAFIRLMYKKCDADKFKIILLHKICVEFF